MSSLYDVLEIPRDATLPQIKKGYRRMAMKYHPDKQHQTNDPKAAEMFIQVIEAFTVLSNESLKKSYDERLAAEEAAAEGMDRERKDMIEDLKMREEESKRTDPLQVYRDELKRELKEFRPKANSHTFEEYENIILSSLLIDET